MFRIFVLAAAFGVTLLGCYGAPTDLRELIRELLEIERSFVIDYRAQEMTRKAAETVFSVEKKIEEYKSEEELKTICKKFLTKTFVKDIERYKKRVKLTAKRIDSDIHVLSNPPTPAFCENFDSVTSNGDANEQNPAKSEVDLEKLRKYVENDLNTALNLFTEAYHQCTKNREEDKNVINKLSANLNSFGKDVEIFKNDCKKNHFLIPNK